MIRSNHGAVALAISITTALAGCLGAEGIDDLDEGSLDLSRRTDGTTRAGSDVLAREWQVPFCAGSVPRDFRTYRPDLIGLSLLPDGTYEAQRAAPQVGQSCAPDARCIGIEVGTYAVRHPVGRDGQSLADRLVLRPIDGTPREYEVVAGFTLSLRAPTTIVTPGAIAGSSVELYPRSALAATFCHDCADTQVAVQRTPGDRSTWTCQDRNGVDLTTPPATIASVSRSPLGTSASFTVGAPVGARVGAARVDATVSGDTYEAEIVLVHDGREARVLPARIFGPLTLGTYSDDFFGERAGGTWTVRVRRRAGATSTRPLPTITSFRLTLTE